MRTTTHLDSSSGLPHSENRHTYGGMFKTGNRTFQSHWELLFICLHFPKLQRKLKTHLRNNQLASVTPPTTAASWELLHKVDPWNKMFQKEREAIHTFKYSFESYKYINSQLVTCQLVYTNALIFLAIMSPIQKIKKRILRWFTSMKYKQAQKQCKNKKQPLLFPAKIFPNKNRTNN